jgi:diguanylate cyclase (GGDEF)-like protein
VTNAWLAAGLGAVVAIDLVLAWVVLGPAFARRLDVRGTGSRDDAGRVDVVDVHAIAALDPLAALADGVPSAAYDRVVRVASWGYVLSTAVVVYLSGLWPATEQPLLLILAIGGVFILVAHDVLPATRLGPVRLVVEGAVAITLATLVVALTGGAASPFFYAYLLVVAGAALIVRPISAVALGSAAAGSYLVAVVVAAGGERLGDGETAIVLVNLTALVLLAYVALVVAREQRRTRDAALRLSTIDALTGLANRAYVLAAVEREIDRATRYRHGFCILMADLDGLKEVNDTLGHQAGDRALASVAAVIRASVRRIDTAARLGGDEFVVLLPETDREGARVVAEKVRQGVAAVDIVERDRRVALGVSIGIGEWVPGRTLDEVMVEADDAMYHEKRRFRAGPAGRGRELAAVGPGWPVEVDEGAVAWPPEVPRGRP